MFEATALNRRSKRTEKLFRLLFMFLTVLLILPVLVIFGLLFYRGYARSETQQHWGSGEELIAAPTGAELTERLAAFCRDGGCDALNLRLHLVGLQPAQIREQLDALGADVLPALRRELAAT